MTARTSAVATGPLFLEISRLMDAPPCLVFRMWSKPEHLVRWLGPKDFTATSERLEFHVGGRYLHFIYGPDGARYGMSGIFREIAEPERIVFTFTWDNTPDEETLVTVTLRAEGDGTRLTFRQEPFREAATRESHESGWDECLDRLVGYVATIAR